MSEFDCIVVGGGVSGLVAASRLGAAGRHVLLLEASERPGGCVQSWRPEAGFWLELGAHTAYNSYAPLLEILAARGRLGELLQRDPLGYRFLRADGRLQAPLARLNPFTAAISLPFALGRAKTGRSVAEWFGGLLGHGNYRRLLAPAFAAVLSQPAEGFPAEWLFRRKPRMQAAPRKFTFAGGLQGLLEALLEDAPFTWRSGARVTEVAREGDAYALRLAGGETLRCQQLVLAVPVDVAAGLLTAPHPEVAAHLNTFPIATSEALAVVVSAQHTSLPRVAGLIGLDDAFYSVVTRDPVAHASYRGYTFHFRPGVLDLAGQRARAAAVLGVNEADFRYVASTVNRLPAPGVEHLPRVAEIDALIQHQPLALVGNYLMGLSIGDCAERAVHECDRLLAL